MTPSPKALLLDFGGVIFQTSKRESGRELLVNELQLALTNAGFKISSEELHANLEAGTTALKDWKNSTSRLYAPTELNHRQIIVDYLFSELPEGPREFLAAEATHWLMRRNQIISTHTVRDGIPELLERCKADGIKLGIVSNAHSGVSHRDLLARAGLDHYFGVQVYSDEVGIRKPNPEMIHLAAEALGVTAEESWYVGDTFDRDVVAGRRANVGGMIITRCHRTDSRPFAIAEEPDAVFDTPAGILDILGTTFDHPAPEPVEYVHDSALLIDHGGVISTSTKDPELLAEFTEYLTGIVGDRETADRVVQNAADGHRAEKARRSAAGETTETSAAQFWVEFGGSAETDQVKALLRSEAKNIMRRWGSMKSRRVLNEGIRELFDYCSETNRPIVLVTNTVSGEGVRDILRSYGLYEQVTAVVASDEINSRKPDAGIVRAALAIAQVDPANAWFYGDKPQNDSAGAEKLGIARRVLVRRPVNEGVDHSPSTDVVDGAFELLELMRESDRVVTGSRVLEDAPAH